MGAYGSIDDWLNSDKLGVQDFSNNGKCSNCGNCCSNFLPMSDAEINIVKKYIKENYIVEQKRVIPLVDPSLDLTCPFRSEKERKCLIYPVRPAICRVFMCWYKKEDLYKRRDEISHHCKTVDCRCEFYGRGNTLELLIRGMLYGK